MADDLGLATDTTVSPTVTPESATVTPTPAADTTPLTVPAAGSPEDKTPKSRHDVIREALNKPSNRGRHAAYQPRQDGKFAPGPAAIPEPQRPAMIKSLKKEMEPHWNAAPRELLEAFAQREQDFEKGAAGWKTKAEQADAILDQFKPYEWILRNENTTPQAAIAPLLQTAAILRTGTPAQKAQSVANVMRQYGIPVEHIQAMMGGQQQAPSPVMDPQYNHLAQQVQNLTQAQIQQEQAMQARAVSVIEQFAADPANTHFAKLQDKMLGLLQAPHILGQDTQYMSEREKLKLAYDTALRLDPELSAQALAQQQAAAQQQAREKAQQAANVAKAAAVQVQGAPGSASAGTVNPNDRRSVIANALRAAQS